MFSNIFRAYHLLPAFWDLITSFGYRTDDSDGYFGGCFSSLKYRNHISPDQYYGRFLFEFNNKLTRFSDFVQIYATISATYGYMGGEKVILGCFAILPYIND